MDIKLHKKQLEAFKQIFAQRAMGVIFSLVFGGAARGGKSWLGCIILFLVCLKYPGVRLFVGRKNLKDVRLSVIEGTFYKVSAKYNWGKYWSFNGQDNIVKFINGSEIYLLELDYYPSDAEYNRFGSYEFTAGWIEEAQEVNFGAYEILKVRTGQHLNTKYGIAPFIYITCNPGKNWLKSQFHTPWKQGRLGKDKAFIQSLYTDNPYREAATDSTLENMVDPSQRSRLKEGDWDYSDDPQAVMTYSMLEKMQQTAYRLGPKKLAVDVARYGDDSTILVYGRGNQVQEITERKKQSIPETARQVKAKIDTDSIDPSNVIIDVVGLGGGVVDLLREWGYPVKAFSGGGRATRAGKAGTFNNIRSQSYWLMREGAEAGELSLDIPAVELDLIAEECTGLRYSIDETKIKVEKKDEFKKRLGRSPDRGDGVTMFFSMDTVAAPVASFAAR